jgi:hypothetical protein
MTRSRPLLFAALLYPALGLALLLAAAPGHAQTPDAIVVADTRFEARSELDGQALVVNGAGMRTRFFLDIYAAALYLPTASTDSAAILAAAGPARLRLVMQRDLGAERFVSALEDGLKANLTEARYREIEPQRTALAVAMRQLGETRKGDVILLESPRRELTRLTVNDSPRATIEGDDFFAALLHIWIGDAPVDAALKAQLLGRGRR